MGLPERQIPADFLSGLARILGEQGLLVDAAARQVYARDASHLTRGRPVAVTLPGDESQLQQVVQMCEDHGVPVVCRGTGTGLSGGAVPGEGALVVGTARLTNLGAVDPILRLVRVQPGVLNDSVSQHAFTWGLHFAPDPSSQSAASIGGNIAENAGGPHCLSQGVTLQHLRGLTWVDGAGGIQSTGRSLAAERGLDLVSLLCGSEGTLGLVTAADLNLTPNPQAVATLLAFFPDLEDGARGVVGLLGAGLAPVAVEMVDQAMLLAVEEAFGFGFPTQVQAAMIVEFAGRSEAISEDCERAGQLLQEYGANEVRRAASEAERTELWKCRKKAFGAVGRLAPSYVTMDVVVPLGELPGLVREIQVITDRFQVEIATAFHAGDGNLHPGVHYDDQDPDQKQRAHAAADAIIRAALDRDGSITGEHGVGIEKLHAVPWQLDAQTASLQRGIKDIFDPGALMNPGKVHPPANVEFAPCKTVPDAIDIQWANLTVSAPAGASVAEIQTAALERGFWIPVGAVVGGPGFGLGKATTVADLVNHLFTGPALCAAGTARDYLLEIWAETGDGKLFHSGAPVFKNVAGYDLAHMLCGSGRVFGDIRGATFQLRPVPESIGCWQFPCPAGHSRPNLLADLTIYLAERDDSLGGPVLVVDTPSGTDAGRATVLVPGRSRTWDLGTVGKDLSGLFSAPAHQPYLELPFSKAGRLLSADHLPAWALDSEAWTAWAAHSDQGYASELWPAGLGRWVWQASPRLVWSPDLKNEVPGWHPDRFCAEKKILPPGPPAEEVPLHFLKALKALFDPSGNLERPAWLEGSDG